MKKIILMTLVVFATFFIVSCDKKAQGDEFDLSNSIPAYVTISGVYLNADEDPQENQGDIPIVAGDEVNVEFSMRTAFQQDVTVYYKVEGAFTLAEQTVVILKDKRSAIGTIVVPANVASGGIATVTLVKAVKQDGKNLTIGQLNDPALEKVILNVQ